MWLFHRTATPMRCRRSNARKRCWLCFSFFQRVHVTFGLPINKWWFNHKIDNCSLSHTQTQTCYLPQNSSNFSVFLYLRLSLSLCLSLTLFLSITHPHTHTYTHTHTHTHFFILSFTRNLFYCLLNIYCLLWLRFHLSSAVPSLILSIPLS